MVLAQAAPDVLPDAPLWAQIVYVALSSLVVAFLLPWLKSMAEKARAKASVDGQAAATVLRKRIEASALEGAAEIAEMRLPDLARKILTTKSWSSEQIKAELRLWGRQLKESLIAEFRQSDGIDLLEVVGDQALDSIVRWAADKTSPFPGKETAQALLLDDWTNKLAKFGVTWVKDHWLKQGEE